MANTTKMISTRLGRKLGLLHDLAESDRIKLQSILLSMLQDLQSACTELGIDVCVIGGSALGSIRHKGFIPWDDDLDVAMTRHDWNIFLSKFSTSSLVDKYDLDSCEYNGTDSKFVLNQLCLKNSEYTMVEDLAYPNHNNIFIDIFIIDKVSNNAIVRKFDAFISDNLRFVSNSVAAFVYKNGFMRRVMHSTIKTRLFYDFRLVQGCICSMVSHRQWCVWFHRFAARHENETTKYTTVAMGLKRYKKEMILTDVWFPYSKGVFEGITVNLPHNPHAYLSEIYGDYMKLPPVEAREVHPIVKLKFPNEQ